MTKEEFFKELDIEEGDSIFFLRHRQKDTITKLTQQIFFNFNPRELMSALEVIKIDLYSEIKKREKDKNND
jgi:hypothetical protein